MGQKKMTATEALGILAYDISDLISRNDGYDGLIPEDRLTQDELVEALPAFFRSLGFDPFAAKPAPAKPEFTEHTCNNGRGPYYGRKTPGCPRCDELIAGAPARDAPARVRNARREDTGGYPTTEEIRRHDCRVSRCGPICTFGQW